MSDPTRKILLSLKNVLTQEEIPLDDVLDDLETNDHLSEDERYEIEAQEEGKKLSFLLTKLAKDKTNRSSAYVTFRKSLKKCAVDLYESKVKPIEEQYKYGEGSSAGAQHEKEVQDHGDNTQQEQIPRTDNQEDQGAVSTNTDSLRQVQKTDY